MGCSTNKAAINSDPNAMKVDAMFLVDCTQSMSSFVSAARYNIKKMSDDFKTKYPDASLQIGFVGYRDHVDNEVISQIALTEDIPQVMKFIEDCKSYGGGDIPEAVADALALAAQTAWRPNSVRFVIHMLDSPPHGKEFTSDYDKYPEGCPCRNNCQKLLKELSDLETQYMMCTFGNRMRETIAIFQGIHKNFQVIALDGQQLTKEEQEDVLRLKGNKASKDERDVAGEVMIQRTTAAVHDRMNKERGGKS
jgi:hypothetical protein